MKLILICTNYVGFFFVVFILNKANREDFSIVSYKSMQYTLKKAFDTSKLNISGIIPLIV